jgi:hypothetical protein
MGKRLIIHQPTNHYGKRFRYYNIFFDKLIDEISKDHDVVVDRYHKNSHKGQSKIKLDWDETDSDFTIQTYECEMIIEDYDTKETKILSIADDLTSTSLNLQSNPNVTEIYICQFIRDKIYSHVQEEHRGKYSPWIYFPSNEYDIEHYYNLRKNTSQYTNKMYFRGDTGSRPILKHFTSDVFYGGNSIGGFDQYASEMMNYSIALSIAGRGELCYRDVECMGMGIPFIRFEYLSELKTPLIPNYHYISVERPEDFRNSFNLDKNGGDVHAKMITDRFLQVKDDKEFLLFISKNSREYYENYLSPSSSINYTRELLKL